MCRLFSLIGNCLVRNADQPKLLTNATAAFAKAKVSVIGRGCVNTQLTVDRQRFKQVPTELNKAVG